MEDRLDDVIGQVKEHIASCSADNVHAREWRDAATKAFTEIKSQLTSIATGRAIDEGKRKGAAWAFGVMGSTAMIAGALIGWMAAHFTGLIFHP
jgi:hypothetical protein